MIVRAAIMRDGGVWSVPKPGRHNHVLDKMRMLGLEKRVHPALPDVQGFLTDTGMFLDRKQALLHCIIARDIAESWGETHTELFSEDLW